MKLASVIVISLCITMVMGQFTADDLIKAGAGEEKKITDENAADLLSTGGQYEEFKYPLLGAGFVVGASVDYG